MLVPPPLVPHAATTNKAADASATARKRLPKCIRVLPLLIDDPAAFFPGSTDFGARVRRQQVYSHSLFGLDEFSGSPPVSVKYGLSRPERPFGSGLISARYRSELETKRQATRRSRSG